MKVAITVSDGRTEPLFVVIENAELYSESQLVREFLSLTRQTRGQIPSRSLSHTDLRS